MPLDDTITPGQLGHIGDHEVIADRLNDLAAVVFKPEDYGAVGDGVADDTAELQACFTAAAAAGVPASLTPGATYKVAEPAGNPVWAIVVPSGLRIIGNGAKVKITGINGALLGAAGDPSAAGAYNAFQIHKGSSNILIEGVVFEGENTAGDGSGGHWSGAIDVDSLAPGAPAGASPTDVTITRCTFRNIYGFSVHHQAGGSRIDVTHCLMNRCSNTINVNGNHCKITDNHFVNSAVIEAGGPWALVSRNVVKDGLSAIAVGGNQSVSTPGSVCSNNVIDGSAGFGISLTDGSYGAVVSGNTVRRTKFVGITVNGSVIRGKNCVITGNTVTAVGEVGQTASLRCGMLVTGHDNVIVSNNVIRDEADVGYSMFLGIYAIGVDGLSISGNNIKSDDGEEIGLEACVNVSLGENIIPAVGGLSLSGGTVINRGEVMGVEGGYGRHQVSGVDFTATKANRIIVMDGVNATLTLPDPSLAENFGTVFVVKNLNATDLTVVSAGTARKIDTAASVTLAQHAKATYLAMDYYEWRSI